MNISTFLDMAAEAFGDRIGVVHGADRYDYAALHVRAQAAAAWLSARQLHSLALLDMASPAFPVAVFAAAYAGVPFVPLNYRLTKEEINVLLARLPNTALVVGDDYAPMVEARADLHLIGRDDFLALPVPVAELPPPEEDPRTVAVQLFTSGTTGAPKAAILRHDNLASYILGTVEFGNADVADATLVSVPPYHVAGISAVLSSTYAARRMVQVERFSPSEWLSVARAESVSNAFVVPTMLTRIVEHLDKQHRQPELPALRALAYGGGKMPLTTIRRAMEMLPSVAFTNAYGLTETSSTIAVLGPDEHRAAMSSDDPVVKRRLGSVGKAAAVELQIRDDDGGVLDSEQTGLVFVRGPQVSGEYQKLGSQLDGDGWFPTKDRGYLDAEGYLFLDGRDDDVIVRGGENISPGEIEDVLREHPAVADVACVAMPDAQWGEAIAAVVVRKDRAQVAPIELQALVKDQLRSSRVPRKIVFRDALPYSELGKLLRRVLRQEFVDTAA